MAFSKNDIKVDAAKETERIAKEMRHIVGRDFRKQGAVIGVSGGIDSSVCLALSVRAFGPKKVLGIAMPEADSNPDSEILAKKLAKQFGVELIVEDMTAALAGFGTYVRRDEAMKAVFPEYDGKTYKSKIVLPTALGDKDTLNIYQLTIITPDGEEKTKRLPLKEYLQMLAA